MELECAGAEANVASSCSSIHLDVGSPWAALIQSLTTEARPTWSAATNHELHSLCTASSS